MKNKIYLREYILAQYQTSINVLIGISKSFPDISVNKVRFIERLLEEKTSEITLKELISWVVTGLEDEHLYLQDMKREEQNND